SMIVSRTKNEKEKSIIIIYHTGAAQGMKRVEVEYLNAYAKFIPEEWNKNFLGVYRFHIIE
ncbi:MAG: DUF1175 family protein, partial [Leptospirales bacterium]